MKIVKTAQTGYVKIYSLLVNLVASRLTLTETGGTVTTDGTEQNIYINDAPAGVFVPREIFIDFTNHTGTEIVAVKEYYRLKSGGDYIMLDVNVFDGVQNPLLKSIKLSPNRFGVKVTIQKTAGTNRAYDYEAIYEV